MDSRIGLDFIVENPEYVRKLAAALDTTNVAVKKQVFELLSALCVYNELGHARAIETLDHYGKLKGERYRLTLIVKELDFSDVVDYQTALVAFVNCLIISTPRLTDRIRLRNEFVGCHLLPVMSNLRKCAEAEPELAVQLDVFDEQRDSDEAQSSHGPHGVDLNSPLDVFYAILRQVAETPAEMPFLAILQHLLRVDPKEATSALVWDAAERLVHRATLIESQADASRLLRSPSAHCQPKQAKDAQRPPAPPPPPLAPPPLVMLPPPPPPCQALVRRLPQQEIPAPRIKMKTINWNKIPSNKVVGGNNVWTRLACDHERSPAADMDWSEMEGLFCQQAQSAPRTGHRDSIGDAGDRRVRKETSEISLLDGKRSLNVNIFLKQFRSSNADIVQMVRNGEHCDVGAEKLKGLLKILPEIDELDMLKSYDGDFDKLGNAEKFLLQLTSLPNYKLRIESMLLKEEFASNMGYLEPSINAMIAAAEDLMTNKPLQEVLYMILVAGNFLNSGGYAGDAAGVKLSSLQKITDIRANKPNMNLIHFVALQAEKRGTSLLSFTDNVNVLEDAAKNTVDQLHNEINALEARIRKIKKQIELPNTERDVKQQMQDFLQMAEREVTCLLRVMGRLESVRKKLAEFFCEDATCFKLEECFRIFHLFCCKFKQALVENERRRLQDEQAQARRRQREELLAAKRRQMESLAAARRDDDTQIYDHAQRKDRRAPTTSEDELSIQGSPSVTRRRLGSFNGTDERSPDVTPTGSIRRRKSRVMTEEDEGSLMDFLRTSGADASRERKSWGSLDRSWARRARGSFRKRPALLGADFASDRERPASPSPLTVPEQEAKPKEWREKIESWLQANEKDDSKQKRREAANRRSLEVDSESDRSNTLDTLPEGKQVYSGSQSTYRKVHPDWKPSSTIDRTDVVGAMETVEDVQPETKDKSAWRKSNLNVANSTEQTTERRRPSGEELSQRKELISMLGGRAATDRLTIYIRKPSDTPPPPPSEVSNKVEIDQDNVETPPATRRVFTPTPVDKREPVAPAPCRRTQCRPADEADAAPSLGDGQFDRHSAARRTRRYKRQQEQQEPAEPEASHDAETRPDKENKPRLEKRHSSREENDEGFEETQSLMSESASQGASSGNYEPEPPAIVAKSPRKPESNKTQNLVQKFNRLERTASTRASAVSAARKASSSASAVAAAARKPAVQRSNSRNSIVSSRSSLNSATSTHTVRRAAPSSKAAPAAGGNKIGLVRVPSAKVATPATNGLKVRPPRPGSSFMKPTAASATKTTAPIVTKPTLPFRSGR